MPGMLKAKVGGNWVAVSAAGGGGGGLDEVHIGPDDPIGANPNVELWYDTDEYIPPPNPIPAWIPMTPLTSPWTQVAGQRSPNSFRKEGDIVRLRLAVTGGDTGSVIFVMPVGYRPAGTWDYVGRDNAGPTMFNVNTSGEIFWYGASTSNNTIVAGNTEYSVTA